MLIVRIELGGGEGGVIGQSSYRNPGISSFTSLPFFFLLTDSGRDQTEWYENVP